MKRFLPGIITMIILFVSFSGTVFSEDPLITIITESKSINVKAGNSCNFNVSFSPKGDGTAAVSKSFSLGYYENLTLIGGEPTLTDFVYNQSYTYSFQTSSDMTGQKMFIPLNVTYTYYDSGGVLRTKNETASVEISISEQAAEPSQYMSSSIEIVSIRAADTPVGERPGILADISNNTNFDVSNAVITVTGGEKPVTKYIGNISAGGAASVELTLDPYENSGQKYLTMRLDYRRPNGTEGSSSKSFYLYITKSAPLSITDLVVPEGVGIGETAEFKFKLVNRADIGYKNAQVSLYKGAILLGTNYIGKIEGESAADIAFNHIFNESGKGDYSFKVSYENNVNRLETAKSFTFEVKSSSDLAILNVVVPDDIRKDRAANISFDISNKNAESFTNANAYIRKNGKELTNKYIGKIEGESNNPITLSYVFAEAGTYEISVTATDPAGKVSGISKSIKVNPAEPEENETAAVLKIQSLLPPIEPLIKTAAEAKVGVTNPTSRLIRGAEMFLYDSEEKEVYSIYISEIAPYSSAEHSLWLITGGEEKTEHYRMKLQYQNGEGKTEIVQKDFSISVKDEKEEETEEETEPEKPGLIKIQKLEAPLLAYAGVRTKIPYTLANGGKGTAYNVEIYVTDNKSGQEIAREYVGNMEAATSTSELYYYTALSELGEFNATLHVIYENFDESRGKTEKSYSQNVIAYRVSISDITGTEWVEAGMQTTIEFAVQNSGTEKLLNTTAYLTDQDSNNLGELFIGTVEPGTKLERQKFKNVVFPSEGEINLLIRVVYENADMQMFEFSGEKTAYVSAPYEPFPDMEMGGVMPEGEIPSEGEGASLAELLRQWAWLLIAVGTVIIVVVVVIITAVGKKKKSKKEDEDIQHFLNQFAKEISTEEKPSEQVSSTVSTAEAAHESAEDSDK